MYYEDHEIEHLNMKDLSMGDRPREKMKMNELHLLSSTDLIAVLLRSGNRKENALDLSKKILKSCNNSLHELSKKSLSFLKKFNGVGEVKALSLMAALELAKRYANNVDEIENITINGSKDLYNIIAPKLSDLKHEEFWVLLISKVGKHILSKRLTVGNESTTTVDAKLIFRTAIENNASNIALAHNHPSGNVNPSDKDKKMTLSLIQASKSIKINIIDHLIVANKNYYSFADHNLINRYKIN